MILITETLNHFAQMPSCNMSYRQFEGICRPGTCTMQGEATDTNKIDPRR
jgi:hypothetical protein